MNGKGLAITLGIGAVAGAVAIMLLPQQCAARRAVNKAAEKVEDAAQMVSDKISQKLNDM